MFKSSLDFFAAQLCSKLELFQERGFRKKGKAIALVKYPIFDQQIFYPNIAQLCSRLELFQERGFRKKGKAIALVKYPIFDQQIFYPNIAEVYCK